MITPIYRFVDEDEAAVAWMAHEGETEGALALQQMIDDVMEYEAKWTPAVRIAKLAAIVAIPTALALSA